MDRVSWKTRQLILATVLLLIGSSSQAEVLIAESNSLDGKPLMDINRETVDLSADASFGLVSDNTTSITPNLLFFERNHSLGLFYSSAYSPVVSVVSDTGCYALILCGGMVLLFVRQRRNNKYIYKENDLSLGLLG